MVGDLCGFTAATYLRGIGFIQIPTTLLSQVDSSIGGKTGVDFDSYKNMVGAFHMPKLVYTNVSVLKTLPFEQFSNGMGEVIKHGLIRDNQYYEWILANKDAILERDPEICRELVYGSNLIKREVVEIDPTEQNERATLNFGHTLGHAVEKLMNLSILHGHCVALGALAALKICAGRGYVSEAQVERYRHVMEFFKMPMNVHGIEKKDVVAATKNDKKMLLIFILLLIIIVYSICLVIKLIQNPTDTFTIEQGKIYQEEQATGYIIRNETVVKGSNYKNGMEQIKTESEKVAKGDSIFRYYTNSEESLIEKIANLDEKINEVLLKEDALFTSDIKVLDKQIETQINSLQKINNLQVISETKKEIANNITKKAKIVGDLSPSGSYLKKLIDERSKYENQLNKGSEYLNAPISGIVSYKVDGYEEILKPNDFSTITKEFLEGLNIKTGQIIADSNESGKIIDNFKCYIACILSSEQAKSAEVGDKVKIRLPNSTEITTNIEYISQGEDTVIILKTETAVEELTSCRKMSFDIIWWSDSGKKVANEAISYEQKGDKQIAYVIRTRAGYQDKVLVKILRQNDKYAIVDNYTNSELREIGYVEEEIKGRKLISLYDEILVKST